LAARHQDGAWTPGPLRSTTVSRIRSFVAGLVWVALAVVIAAGIAG
jgi:hypothetical protein